MGQNSPIWGQWRQIHLSRRQGENKHTFEIAQGLSKLQNEPLEPKGPVVTSEAKHHPMGCMNIQAAKTGQEGLEQENTRTDTYPLAKVIHSASASYPLG
jgi:hypothetical protein